MSASPLLVLFGWGVGLPVARTEGEILFAQAKAWGLRHGTEAAAAWLEEQGIKRELALYALVGSRRASRYGARPVDICKKPEPEP